MRAIISFPCIGSKTLPSGFKPRETFWVHLDKGQQWLSSGDIEHPLSAQAGISAIYWKIKRSIFPG
jgi:hypothetical protein